MSDSSTAKPPTPPSVPPDERIKALLTEARLRAERNVRVLRSELHALAEIVAEKERLLQNELGAVNAFAVSLEQVAAVVGEAGE